MKDMGLLQNEHDRILWRILNLYGDKARKAAYDNQVKHIDTNETSRRCGHNYVNLFVGLNQTRVLFATDGKDASSLDRFKQDIIEHARNPRAIEEMCCDISPSLISSVENQFPETHIIFQEFYNQRVQTAEPFLKRPNPNGKSHRPRISNKKPPHRYNLSH